MKLYKCIFSKYDDSKTVSKNFNFNPRDMKNSIIIEVEANTLKEAFEKSVKSNDVDRFWDMQKTIHPFYVNNNGNYVYYHKQFDLY